MSEMTAHSTTEDWQYNCFTLIAEHPYYFTEEEKALHVIGPVHGPELPTPPPEVVQAFLCRDCDLLFRTFDIHRVNDDWFEYRCPNCGAQHGGGSYTLGQLDIGLTQ